MSCMEPVQSARFTFINETPIADVFTWPWSLLQICCMNWCGTTKTRMSASLHAPIKSGTATFNTTPLLYHVIFQCHDSTGIWPVKNPLHESHKLLYGRGVKRLAIFQFSTFFIIPDFQKLMIFLKFHWAILPHLHGTAFSHFSITSPVTLVTVCYTFHNWTTRGPSSG